MIFYKSDGSINFSKTDQSFGWDLSDCDSCASQDQEDIPSSKKLLKKLVKENMHDNIQVGYVEEITSMLINLDTFESNLLLSIISRSLYNKMSINKNKPVVKNSFIQKVTSTNIREDNMLSDIGVVDMNVTQITDDLHIRDSLSAGAPEYRIIKSKEWKCLRTKEGRFAHVGPEADIDKTLRNFFDNARELHGKVQEIKECFLQQHSKIDELISECATLQQDILETKYMDDIINLLQNNLLSVKRNWPFRILNQSDEGNTNFIV